MPSIDTNVLVRWLVADDGNQYERARVLLLKARQSRETLFVPKTVLLELEWVLRSSYRFDKPTILKAISELLEADELLFETAGIVEHALDLFQDGSADFADCMHVATCVDAGHAPLLTFDRRAAMLPGVELLKTACH